MATAAREHAGGAAPSRAPLGDGTTVGGRMAERWRRARWVVAVGLVVLVAALAIVLSLPRGSAGHLDPGNPGPDGARAVAQILRAQGVVVDKVRRSTDAASLATHGTTLLVVQTDLLGPAHLDRLAGTGADLVLVQPDLLVLDRLAPQVQPRGIVDAGAREPGCDAPAATAAGDARAGGHLYGVQGRAELCYSDPATPRSGSYVTTRAGGRRVTVIGQEEVLGNAHLAEHGNAALSLRTLGAQPRLIWYVPDPLEPASGDEPPAAGPGSVWALLPRWVPWVAAQVGLAVLVSMIWRARRLGRLVTEPLPVVVRAAETEEGRARLYRQARARNRAAATLRTAALRRFATMLAVSPGTTPEQVTALVAASSGRPESQVGAILLGPPPTSDTDLVSLADALDSLERHIAERSLPGGSRTVPGRNTEP